MTADAKKGPSKDVTPKDIAEIMSLLVGVAPSADNVQHVLERRYVFGDAQLPSKSSWLNASSTSHDDDETLSYFLGLPPSKEMCAVTDQLLQRAQSSDFEGGSTPLLSDHAIEQQQQQQVATHHTMWQRRSSFDVTSSPPVVTTPCEDRAESFPPLFSVAEYDVVSYVLRQARDTAERCGRSLYHATHTSKGSRTHQPPKSGVSSVDTAALLPMPEALLGA